MLNLKQFCVAMIPQDAGILFSLKNILIQRKLAFLFQ